MRIFWLTLACLALLTSPVFGVDIELVDTSGNSAGVAFGASTVVLNEKTLVTLVRRTDSRMSAIGWDVDDDGNISRFASRTNLVAHNLDAIKLKDDYMASVHQSSGGRMRVSTWYVSKNSQSIDFRGSSNNQAGGSSEFKIVRLNDRLVATMLRSTSGTGLILLWQISENGREITRMAGSPDLGPMEVFDAKPLGGNKFLTARQNSEKKLQMTVWSASESGDRLIAIGTVEAERLYIDQVSLAPVSENEFVVATRNRDMILAMDKWWVGAGGDFTHVSSNSTSTSRIEKVEAFSIGYSKVVTAVKFYNHVARFIIWDHGSNIDFERVVDSVNQAKTLGYLNAVKLRDDMLVMSLKANVGRHRVFSWKINE